jgi:tRNA threonylcarbamoyladenosine biosynthesis protein TsaE
MTYEIITKNSEETQAFARRLSRFLPSQMTIELVSDLGGGKTTFVQGLAAGLGYPGPVTSPTFTITNEYLLPDDRAIHHYDLYRLGHDGPLPQELTEDLNDESILTVIEWPDRAGHHLPADRLTIKFLVTGDDSRRLHLTAPGPRGQAILKELQA